MSGNTPCNPPTEPDNVTRLVNIQEMAQILGVHPNWLYQRTRLGSSAIPFIRVGRYVRFDVADVVAFLKKNGDVGKQGCGVVS